MTDNDQQTDLTTFNLVASTILTIFGVFTLAYLIPTHIPEPTGIEQGLSAQFMPTVAVGTMTLLSSILGLNVFIRRVRGLEPIPEDNEDNDDHGFGLTDAINTGFLLFGSAIYIGLLSTSGFMISTVIILVFCFYLGRIRNWLLIGALSLGVPFVLTKILWWGLTVQLPASPFFQ